MLKYKDLYLKRSWQLLSLRLNNWNNGSVPRPNRLCVRNHQLDPCDNHQPRRCQLQRQPNRNARRLGKQRLHVLLPLSLVMMSRMLSPKSLPILVGQLVGLLLPPLPPIFHLPRRTRKPTVPTATRPPTIKTKAPPTKNNPRNNPRPRPRPKSPKPVPLLPAALRHPPPRPKVVEKLLPWYRRDFRMMNFPEWVLGLLDGRNASINVNRVHPRDNTMPTGTHQDCRSNYGVW
mmetsp:Transcript_11951/g.34075  ORF Transcript_11951/g.34075 Transcript_11951/m.34075 type:complete len:232 (+) Transcript_11951:768-1463(+)